MVKENQLNVLHGQDSPPRRFTRREMAQRLLTGLGAGLAWPVISASHPLRAHLANELLMGEVDSQIASVNWKPLFLSEKQHASLFSLAEAVVPGSTKAHVSRFIDLLLSADKPKNQRDFVDSLAAIDAESERRFTHSFASLTADQRHELLTAASTASPSGDAASPLRQYFDHLKEWIAGAYYSSEDGMRELGWTPDRVFSAFPGCAHPDGHS